MRVAWDRTPSPGTSALGLFIDVGSRDEWEAVFGASHFLEHAVFKGAGARGGREIAEAGDALGAEINAFTTRDYTCFYGKSMDPMLSAVYDLVQSMVHEPWLASADIDRERQVILEEMRQSYDDTGDRVAEAFMRAMYEDAIFTHDVLGNETSIQNLTVEQLRDFHRRFYVPRRMALALAGEGGRQVIEQLEAADTVGRVPQRRVPKPRPSEVVIEEDREQVQVLLGVPAPFFGSDDAYVCDLLATLLGGQTSSRLWQRLREEEGLVYSVDVDYEAEPDWGVMTVGLAVHPSRLEQALHLVGEELNRAIRQGFSETEIARAKIQQRAGLWFGFETVDHRMLHLGRHLLRNQLPLALPDVEARIEEVGASELAAMTKALWEDPNRVALAVVGAVGGVAEQGLKHLL